LRRRLFNVATVASFVLFIGAAALVIRSYAGPVKYATSTSPTKTIDLAFYGKFFVLRIYNPTLAAPFANHQGVYKQFPLWPLPVLAGVLPGAWLVSKLARGRGQQTGRCSGCGYDLRATPDRCPECGKVQVQGEAAAR
jgi:hypothetical protein